MSDQLLLNPSTRTQLELFLVRPSHALLITGSKGSGKKYLARHIAAHLLNVSGQKLAQHPYYRQIDREKGRQEIPIDEIRRIIKELELKPVMSGGKITSRAIVINDAHHLSIEAQNALLKVMEEPGQATVFILTSQSADALLPTIVSRAQKLSAGPVGQPEAKAFYAARHPAAHISKSWQLSQGQVGLLDALLDKNDGHVLAQAVNEAKMFLKMNRYERLISIDKVSGSREALQLFLEALGRILSALHRSAITSGRKDDRLTAARKIVIDAQKSLGLNTNSRLIAVNLALSLPV